MTILFLFAWAVFLPFLAGEVGDCSSDSSDYDSYDLESSILTQLEYIKVILLFELSMPFLQKAFDALTPTA